MTNSAPVFTAGGGSDDAFTRVSTSATGAQADGASVQAAFSPDGTKVAFASYADNLVPGDTNGAPDVFVKDLSTGAITLVSTDASGVQLGGYQPIFFARWHQAGVRNGRRHLREGPGHRCPHARIDECQWGAGGRLIDHQPDILA